MEILEKQLVTGGESSSKDNRNEFLTNSKEDDEPMPFIGNFVSMGQSRLLNEFEVQEHLGKGGFGSVIKVNTYVFFVDFGKEELK